MNICIVSGWTGYSNLREFYRFDDGRSDMIIKLVDSLRLNHSVYIDRNSFPNSCDIEIHINYQIKATNSKKTYLIIFEDYSIRPQNKIIEYFNYYTNVFSWDNKLLRKLRNGVKYNFPHDYYQYGVIGNSSRDLFLTHISTNRNVVLNKKKEMYSARFCDIVELESIGADFSLYGRHWDIPFCKPGVFERLKFELIKQTKIVSKKITLECFRGSPTTKREVLERSKFCLAYENVNGLDGYISEKIFDCFASLTVPVYLPSYDTTQEIPSDCFINRSDFKSATDLYLYLKSIDDIEYIKFQNAIINFNKNLSKNYSISEFLDVLNRSIFKLDGYDI